MRTLAITTARQKLGYWLKRALAGEDVIIAKAGEPMVRLTPVQQDLTPRQGGQLKGKIWISDDFDDFDEELEEMLYGSKE